MYASIAQLHHPQVKTILHQYKAHRLLGSARCARFARQRELSTSTRLALLVANGGALYRNFLPRSTRGHVQARARQPSNVRVACAAVAFHAGRGRIRVGVDKAGGALQAGARALAALLDVMAGPTGDARGRGVQIMVSHASWA